MPIYKIGNILNKASLFNYKKYNEKYIYYINLSNCKSDYDYFEEIIDLPSRAKWFVSQETILVGRVRPENKNFIFLKKGNKYIASSGFAAYTEKSKKFLIKFIWFCINKEQFITYCKLRSIGSTYKEIKSIDLDNYKINIPDTNSQKEIIDIIEPIEKIEKLILRIEKLIYKVIISLPNNKKSMELKKLCTIIKNKPANIKQISAKMLNSKSTFIIGFENQNTYQTNSYYCPKQTLVINTIRTYLNKFAIIPDDCDANGTLAMLVVKNNWTSILNNLLKNDFWKIANSLSQGTKMPVLKLNDLLNIKINLVQKEINGIEKLLVTLSNLKLKLDKVKLKIINLLIK